MNASTFPPQAFSFVKFESILMFNIKLISSSSTLPLAWDNSTSDRMDDDEGNISFFSSSITQKINICFHHPNIFCYRIVSKKYKKGGRRRKFNC